MTYQGAAFGGHYEKGSETCQWFALCNRPATGTTSHPILGEVPTCDKCHAFATGGGTGLADELRKAQR